MARKEVSSRHSKLRCLLDFQIERFTRQKSCKPGFEGNDLGWRHNVAHSHIHMFIESVSEYP